MKGLEGLTLPGPIAYKSYTKNYMRCYIDSVFVYKPKSRSHIHVHIFLSISLLIQYSLLYCQFCFQFTLIFWAFSTGHLFFFPVYIQSSHIRQSARDCHFFQLWYVYKGSVCKWTKRKKIRTLKLQKNSYENESQKKNMYRNAYLIFGCREKMNCST